MDTAEITAALEREKELATRRLAEFDAVGRELAQARGDADGDDEHDPEGSTVAWERATAQATTDGVSRRLAEVEAALARIAGGWNGECARCGNLINAERLAARPSADMCVACASRRR